MSGPTPLAQTNNLPLVINRSYDGPRRCLRLTSSNSLGV